VDKLSQRAEEGALPPVGNIEQLVLVCLSNSLANFEHYQF